MKKTPIAEKNGMQNINRDRRVIVGISELDKFGLLNIFKYVEWGLFTLARVCKKWNDIIVNKTNQKTILFRSVTICEVQYEIRNNHIRLARNICHGVYTSNDRKISEEDIQYFKNYDTTIAQKIACNKAMFKYFLVEMNEEHAQCKTVVMRLMDRQPVNNIDLERFQDHLPDILDIMLEFLSNNLYRYHDYGLTMILIFKRIIPTSSNGVRLQIINAFTNRLINRDKVLLRIIEEEAEAFYEMLQLLDGKGNSEVKNAGNILLGLMAIEFSFKNICYHSNDFWELFFTQFLNQSSITSEKDYNDINYYIVFGITKLLESKNRTFTLYCRDNVNKLISFLEAMLFNKPSSCKYIILCAFNLILNNQDLLSFNEKEEINLIFQKYFQKQLESQRIELNTRQLKNLLIWGNVFDEAVLKECLRIFPKDLRKDQSLEIFISRIPEKLINFLTDERKSEIINLFRSNIEYIFIRSLEKAFDVYLDFFNKLYLNSSFIIRQQVVLLIGEIVLNGSKSYSRRGWEAFFKLVHQDNALLRYINQAVCISEGLLNARHLNFAREIRDSLDVEDVQNRDFVQYFNENKETFFNFLKGQFAAIRVAIVRVEVTLTIITVLMKKIIKEDNKHYEKELKGWLNDKFQNNPDLRRGVNGRINEIIDRRDRENLKYFLRHGLN